VDIQFSQHYFEEDEFSPMYILGTFVKNQMPIAV
jgi:hypothetical protein